MPRTIMITAAVCLVSSLSASQTAAQPKRDRTYVVSAETLKAIKAAAPEAPVVAPKKDRRVLVYGRVPTHPESVACCFKAMEILGRKTGPGPEIRYL